MLHNFCVNSDFKNKHSHTKLKATTSNHIENNTHKHTQTHAQTQKIHAQTQKKTQKTHKHTYKHTQTHTNTPNTEICKQFFIGLKIILVHNDSDTNYSTNEKY